MARAERFPTTIIELFERAVATHGPRPALVIKPGFRTRIWTYDDLGDLEPRVARVLCDAGVMPGDRVLVWAVNRPEWGIGFLGLLWAGAVAVPVDVRTTDELAMKVAAQTRAKLVLASLPTLTAASRLELPAMAIESLVDRAHTANPLPRPDVDPDGLAEIVFTSGTTGDPKGVMLSHANIATNAASLASVVPLGPETRLLSILPMSHMYGLNPGFLTPLVAGASVVYPTSLQPSVLARTFRERRVTMFLAVPQAVKLLNNAIERRVDADGRRATFERLHAIGRRAPTWLRRVLFRPVLARFGGSLRYVTTGGAAMNPNVARRWAEMGVDCLQGYGATETSPVTTFTRLEDNRVGTVGQVLPGVELRIAPDGEILVRGPNIFMGYWERPDATAAVLEDGWYHTGDHGVLDAEGFLTLQGRKKDMLVMPDGTKVHPADIEAVLVRDERVSDASVVGVEHLAGETQVHAVLILRDPSEAGDVVRTANGRLGGHQQIRGWSVWPNDDFPRNALRKVLKRDIQAWVEAQGAAAPPSSPSANAVAAATAIERLARQIDGVPADAVDPDARLSSDLGIDSLGRVELLGMVEEELGIYIDDGDLDPDETVGGLQARVDAAGATGAASPESGIYGWPLNPLIGLFRIGVQQLLLQPVLSLFYRRRVRGLEHLRGLSGPVMFAPNHHLHNDAALILCAIPVSWRAKLSAAAAADDIFERQPWRGFLAALLANAFPMAREGAVRRSLDYLGARLDRGYSVLIFPEGKLTVGGPLQEFKTGTGLVAIHGRIPVVPIRLVVHRHSRIDADAPGTSLRGDVEVVFGRPLTFAIDDDPVRATAEIRAAVEAL